MPRLALHQTVGELARPAGTSLNMGWVVWVSERKMIFVSKKNQKNHHHFNDAQNRSNDARNRAMMRGVAQSFFDHFPQDWFSSSHWYHRETGICSKRISKD